VTELFLSSAHTMGHENRSTDDKTTQPDRFLWRWPVLAVVVPLVLFAPVIISGDPLLQIAYFFLAAPIIVFFILIAAIVKKDDCARRFCWRS
jgi:hypothetical protein